MYSLRRLSTICCPLIDRDDAGTPGSHNRLLGEGPLHPPEGLVASAQLRGRSGGNWGPFGAPFPMGPALAIPRHPGVSLVGDRQIT
jgi:hypothetical protein